MPSAPPPPSKRPKPVLKSCKNNRSCDDWKLKYKCAYCKPIAQRKLDAKERVRQLRKEEKKKQREILQKMTPKQRAALRQARRDTAVVHADTNDCAMGSGRSFLSLPPEIRYGVYAHLFDKDDVLFVIATQPYTIPRHPDFTGLYQVCRLLRVEMERYFHTYHEVVFQTGPGLTLWNKKKSEHLLWMHTVEFEPKVYPSLNRSTLQHFQNLTRLILQLPVSTYDRCTTDQYRGLNTHTGWEHLLAWRLLEVIVDVLPQFHGDNGVVQCRLRPSPSELRFQAASKYPRKVKNSRREYDPDWLWHDVDVASLVSKIDVAVEDIRAGRWEVPFPKGGVDGHKSVKNFIRKGLDR